MNRSIAGIAYRDGKCFLARRDSVGDLAGKWEFPGGKVEAGESDRRALEREFSEEFGFDIRVGEWLGTSGFVHAGRDYELHAYRVELPDRMPEFLECHVETAWIPVESLDSLDLADSDRALLSVIGDRIR